MDQPITKIAIFKRIIARKILYHLVTITTFFITISSPIYAETSALSPSNNQVSFDNQVWTTNNPQLVTKITSPFSGIKLDCSQGQSVVHTLTLPIDYEGNISFDFIEQPKEKNALNYFFSIREVSGSRIEHSLDIGHTTKHRDYNNQDFGTNHFFYSTRLDSNNRLIGADSFVQRLSDTNTVSLLTTPAGAYAKINKINLAYLPSNKDAINSSKVFYPVDYEFTKFNQIIVACPWTDKNTTNAGYLLVKNPTITSIPPQPDRKTILTTVAKTLLENFPSLPTGSLSEIPSVAYSSNLPKCNNSLLTNPNAYTNWTIGYTSRINAIKAYALTYLYPKSAENYAQIKSELSLGIRSLANDNGITSSVVALAYWTAVNKYPEKINDLPAIDAALRNKAAALASSPVPTTGYIGRSGGDANVYKGTFLTLMATMYGVSDWDAKGKCFFFHSATKSTSETPIPAQNGCNYQTKTVWSGNEANDPTFIDAKKYFVDLGTPFDGRYDNHNYSPQETYVYGSNLGEMLKFYVAYGGNQTNTFGPTVRHEIDALYSQNLSFVDFAKNLWNSKDIILLTPIHKPAPHPNISIPYYDERQYCGSYYDNFTNMYRTYSKSDNFLDPANAIDGFLLGSLYKKDFSRVDQLLKNIWYVANDYGVIPFDPNLTNIHPGLWQEDPHNTIRSLIFPAVSLERYVLSAMALDPSFSLKPLSQLQPLPGDLNKDGKVNIFDYNELATKFGKPYTVTDYKNILENFGK